MDFCSVTVWFNPDDLCVQNILSYSALCKKCFIVDNSSGDNSALAAKIPNAVYIPNGGNLGIAAALNTGCKRALEEGFLACMTMDQDSSWDAARLKEYFDICKKSFSDTAVSFCPSASYAAPTSLLGDAKRFLRRAIKGRGGAPAAASTDSRASTDSGSPTVAAASAGKTKMPCCITSGNVILLSAWQKVGGFYEPFFIDEVDHEFCFRLNEAGYEIFKFDSCLMNHVLGKPKKTFYPCVSHHSGPRLYYIFRNAFFLKKMHPAFYKRQNYSKQIRQRVAGLLFNCKFSQLRYLLRAWLDFKRGKLGPLGK